VVLVRLDASQHPSQRKATSPCINDPPRSTTSSRQPRVLREHRPPTHQGSSRAHQGRHRIARGRPPLASLRHGDRTRAGTRAAPVRPDTHPGARPRTWAGARPLKLTALDGTLDWRTVTVTCVTDVEGARAEGMGQGPVRNARRPQPHPSLAKIRASFAARNPEPPPALASAFVHPSVLARRARANRVGLASGSK